MLRWQRHVVHSLPKSVGKVPLSRLCCAYRLRWHQDMNGEPSTSTRHTIRGAMVHFFKKDLSQSQHWYTARFRTKIKALTEILSSRSPHLPQITHPPSFPHHHTTTNNSLPFPPSFAITNNNNSLPPLPSLPSSLPPPPVPSPASKHHHQLPPPFPLHPCSL